MGEVVLGLSGVEAVVFYVVPCGACAVDADYVGGVGGHSVKITD